MGESAEQCLTVQAEQRTQVGLPILVGRCPKCNAEAALSSEGRHCCRGCGAWLQFRKKES